jgi:hypothetical protein
VLALGGLVAVWGYHQDKRDKAKEEAGDEKNEEEEDDEDDDEQDGGPPEAKPGGKGPGEMRTECRAPAPDKNKNVERQSCLIAPLVRPAWKPCPGEH